MILAPAAIHACGPFFPNTVLGDVDYELLLSPSAYFGAEIDMLRPHPHAVFRAVRAEEGFYNQTRVAETNDLTICLAEDGALTAVEKDAVAEYAHARQQIAAYQERLADCEHKRGPWRGDNPPKGPTLPEIALPRNVPQEFSLYLRGATAWYTGDTGTAQRAWAELLDVPALSRRYRSTWAAFMLGRSMMESDPDEAVGYFHKVRELAKNEYKDSVGLATASMGWEAYIAFRRRDYEQATTLYLEQRTAGDCTAVSSLRAVASAIIRSGSDVLAEAAESDVVRPVVTAYLLATRGGVNLYADPGSENVRRWLRAIETAGGTEVVGADRLAWAAYRVGEVVLAEKWAKLAPATSPITRWVKAKLSLREGDTRSAKQLLTEVLRSLPAKGTLGHESTKRKAASELASLHMADGEYTRALDLLIRHDWWWDSAYVAERVLSTTELKRYVDTHWPEDKNGYREDGRLSLEATRYRRAKYPGAIAARIRYLLARRLARAERFEDASEYYPPFWRKRLKEYSRSLRRGRVSRGSLSMRGESLWKAARLARYEGIQLFGTEVEPDWFTVGGIYDPAHLTRIRSQSEGSKIAAPSEDELRRVRENGKSYPTKRFHYRYLASDLAWLAAELMPDESRDTAEMLCWGGTWIKNNDPKAADRFYKALVNRCRSTDLGKEADSLRWFPKMTKPDYLK